MDKLSETTLAKNLEGLAELGTVVAAAQDALNDEMVTRMASVFTEGIALMDRLTRNEALVNLLQTLDRPENQAVLVSLSKALTQTSRDINASIAPNGGIGGLIKLMADPKTQAGLQALSLLGQHFTKNLRDISQSSPP